MNAILVHGMGRTPASQLVLAARLRLRGVRVHFFGYSARGSFTMTVSRLEQRVASLRGPYILIGHSLGAVLIRSVLPRVAVAPAACFFLAPPSTACRAARHFAKMRLFGIVTGEMGRLLADEGFMRALPMPAVPTRIYAGTAGPRGRLSPFGEEANDGILAVSETALEGVPLVRVDALHTFIMNSPEVADDIAAAIGARRGSPL